MLVALYLLERIDDPLQQSALLPQQLTVLGGFVSCAFQLNGFRFLARVAVDLFFIFSSFAQIRQTHLYLS
mgnify:CR=1 FL=1